MALSPWTVPLLPFFRSPRWQVRASVSLRSMRLQRTYASKETKISPSLTQRKVAQTPTSNSFHAFRPYVARLAMKSSPTLLYQAPSHASYKTGCYVFGGFCISYAAFNIYDKLLFPVYDIPNWIRVTQTGICLALFVVGPLYLHKVNTTATSIFCI